MVREEKGRKELRFVGREIGENNDTTGKGIRIKNTIISHYVLLTRSLLKKTTIM